MIPAVIPAGPAPLAGGTSPARPFADALAAARSAAPPGQVRCAPVAGREVGPAIAPRPAPTAPALLQAVDRARIRLDGVLAQARAGRTFSGAELLALQAEAYRTAQTVDLAVRLVEQGGQAVKQALATPL